MTGLAAIGVKKGSVLRLAPLTDDEQFASGVEFYASVGELLMISQFFEVQIKDGHVKTYKDLAR
jgi:hypothetical protein